MKSFISFIVRVRVMVRLIVMERVRVRVRVLVGLTTKRSKLISG